MRTLTLLALFGAIGFAPACGGGGDDDPTATGDDDDTTGDDDDGTPTPTGDDDDDTTAPLDCSTRPTDIPTARGEIEGVFSPLSRKFVFFGGDEGIPVNCQSQTDFVADTWLWEEDCGNWRKVESTDGPMATARYAHGYDPVRDRFLIHGGRFRDGTSGNYTLRNGLWAFDFATETWSLLSQDGPSKRAIHAGAVAGDRFVVFGGTGSTDGLSYVPLYSDVWVYDLAANTWTELPTTGGPGGRVFHAMTSDGGDELYVYAGGDENAFFGPFYRELWMLDLTDGSWTMLDDASAFKAPDGRIWPDLMYDEVSGQLVMWAGHDDQAMGNTNQLYTWSFDGTGWDKVRMGDSLDAGSNGFCDFPADFVAVDANAPERRYGAASAMTGDGTLLTFGGKTDCGIINDLWRFDLATAGWERLLRATDGESCVRAFDPDSCSSLCF